VYSNIHIGVQNPFTSDVKCS